jgi:hypothetical protein
MSLCHPGRPWPHAAIATPVILLDYEMEVC